MLRRCEFVLALVLNLDSVEEVHSLTCTSRAQAASPEHPEGGSKNTENVNLFSKKDPKGLYTASTR